MPPKPKTEIQLQKDKDRIIKVALEIICKQGLDGLTIRKLSAKLKMSAANIYNYFYNKDEIYLYILISGFDLLQVKLEQAIAGIDRPLEKLNRAMRAVIQFGMENTGYYELMFSTQDPKSLDYRQTPVEQLAIAEKANAMRAFALMRGVVADCAPDKSEQEVFAVSTRIICEMHGCINLYHTNIIKEIGAPVKDVMESLIEHVLAEFAPQ